MQDRTYLKQKYRKISVALISNLLILGAMAAFMRPSFETNDDIVFAELGSGLRGVKGCTSGISELRTGNDLPPSVWSDRQTAMVIQLFSI